MGLNGLCKMDELFVLSKVSSVANIRLTIIPTDELPTINNTKYILCFKK